MVFWRAEWSQYGLSHLVVLPVTDRVPQDIERSFHVTEELSQDGNVNVLGVGGTEQ